MGPDRQCSDGAGCQVAGRAPHAALQVTASIPDASTVFAVVMADHVACLQPDVSCACPVGMVCQ